MQATSFASWKSSSQGAGQSTKQQMFISRGIGGALALSVICMLSGCSTNQIFSEELPSDPQAEATDADPEEFKERIAMLQHGMSIEEVIRIFGSPRMDSNLGEGQRLLSFAKIYEGGRIRSIALSFQDGKLIDIPSAR